MFTRHYNINDVNKSANVTLLLHATSGHQSPPLGILSCPIFLDLLSVEKFQENLELQRLQPVSYPVNTLEASNLMWND